MRSRAALSRQSYVPVCDFFPDWPVADGSDEKVPYRFRWPDEVRDGVLGRLLAENQRRVGTDAKGEVDEGDEEAPASGVKGWKKAKAARNAKIDGGGQGTLL